jgi:lysyl-tRNA synthetase class 2
MNWRASSSVAVARQRAAMLERARAFFDRREVLEVDTPALSRYATSDPQIDGHRVTSGDGRTLYLQTSPESYMKRLLADGYPDIYSICRVFRDGEAGSLHQPEFTMVEWYRHDFGLYAMAAETVAFIANLLGEPAFRDVDTFDYVAAFEEFASINPLTAGAEVMANAADADADLRKSLGDDRDAWLDLVLSTRVAPHFSKDRLTVLRHFPASQAALARLCPDDDSVADRFEVFFGPIELANGFVELTDATEQRRRIAADLEKRRAADRPSVAMDEALLAALESGLPACAGVAVGLERLLMIAANRNDIRDVVTFAFDDNDG